MPDWHSYRERFPETDHIVVETIHSGFAIYRSADQSQVRYSPPTRLRRYDLILIDEASQIEDYVTEFLYLAIQELPQKPFVAIAADFFQLNPIQGGGTMRVLCSKIRQVELRTIYRTTDVALLDFLATIRLQQPAKAMVAEFFSGRHLTGSLPEAVAYGLALGRQRGQTFSWLCVTNAGAAKVNRAALSLLQVSGSDLACGYRCGPKVRSDFPIVARVGLCIRLTRNLDKDRGFVNGAIEDVHAVLTSCVFLVKLSSGNMVLVHPVSNGGETPFLHCTYGYATTINRAQGASLSLGCIHFDHSYPPDVAMAMSDRHVLNL